MAKNIRGFLETLFEYYLLSIIVNVNFSDLKFEYYCQYSAEIPLQASLKSETKIDGRGHKKF